MDKLQNAQSAVQAVIETYSRSRNTQRKLDRLSDKVDKMASSQLHTDERLNALIGSLVAA